MFGRRRRPPKKTLVTMVAKNLTKKDTKRTPSVDLRKHLYPISHSSKN